ncbi:Hsp70 family protein [Aquabacterium sp. A7-Y]|uniref:Hsp70 family protein n=1 Tax=Aquabacterium sp. A7-Y TaxID=1349605 RepID=UPI00223C9BF0|nr:Hsp70 family protein [Aquabacterium sp. A7-Y]MCW7536589.1 Hsp70 family protein [Aquabacterium sp. A7-Y]
MTRSPDHCAIDFGTSNSAIAIPSAGAGGHRLVELEDGRSTMPTAVFYFADPHDAPVSGPLPLRAFGRAAVAAYVEGYDGRLMRSMKSILGSSLAEQATDVGGGQSVKYLDVITGYLHHLKSKAEAAAGGPLRRVVMGRPVYFVDEDPQRDAQAQSALEAAARAVGFADVCFQYEPIAAAFDYEQQAQREELVLVADIGGGTSDFSVVRVGPARRSRLERKHDILANHGVHIAGTDFDRRVELAALLPPLGYRALGRAAKGQPPREVPSAVYFDLATWHLINTLYNPTRVAELQAMAGFYADPAHHRRLMHVVRHRLGHELAARAEAAKIAVAGGGSGHRIDLGVVEPGLSSQLDEAQAAQALAADLDRIVAAARETVKLAGVSPDDISALYFTGGSTGLRLLTDRLAAAFPAAAAVRGDGFASVATGLGIDAARRFATH